MSNRPTRLSLTTQFTLRRLRLIKKRRRISGRINLSTPIRSNQHSNLLTNTRKQRRGTRHHRLHRLYTNTNTRRHLLHPRFRLLHPIMLRTNTRPLHRSNRYTKGPQRLYQQTKHPNPKRQLTSNHSTNIYPNTNTKRQRREVITKYTTRPQPMYHHPRLQRQQSCPMPSTLPPLTKRRNLYPSSSNDNTNLYLHIQRNARQRQRIQPITRQRQPYKTMRLHRRTRK